MAARESRVVRSSGNVFADLGLPDAKELSTKAALTFRINEIIGGLTQQGAAERLGLPQPKVSRLRNYQLENFSVEKLLTLLTKLDQDVEIIVRRRPKAQRRDAHIVVMSA